MRGRTETTMLAPQRPDASVCCLLFYNKSGRVELCCDAHVRKSKVMDPKSLEKGFLCKQLK